MSHSQLESLQERIGYAFKNTSLLREALIHPSYLHDHPNEPKNNQRLEFLGDAVLALILSDKLFRIFPDEREGTLTQNRSNLANGLFLSDLAERLGLHNCLFMSKPEMKLNGNKRPSTLEDAFEALIGAIYLDSDLPTTREVVLQWYGDIQRELKGHEFVSNPKGRLQEMIQPEHGNDAIRYQVKSESGEDHDKSFVIELFLLDELLATGTGKSKKEAETKAAISALEHWTKKRK